VGGAPARQIGQSLLFVCGDFKGQRRPPSDIWSDAIRRYEDSDDIWALAEGLHNSLSHYRRRTHRGYFNWYGSLYADVPEDDASDYIGRAKLARHILVARERLPWDGSPSGVHVVLSNDKRKLIKRRCNELQRRARPNSVFAQSCDDESSFYCHPGQQPRPRATDKKQGLFKNVLDCVQVVTDNECVLRMHEDYGDDAPNISLALATLAKFMRTAYRVVYLHT